MLVEELALRGKHNLYNSMAAAIAVRVMHSEEGHQLLPELSLRGTLQTNPDSPSSLLAASSAWLDRVVGVATPTFALERPPFESHANISRLAFLRSLLCPNSTLIPETQPGEAVP